MTTRLKYCTVCASNSNRSMEAHKVLKENGFLVRSYGTGSAVRLPGPTFDKPNVFPFGTPYDKILEVLNSQDTRMHRSNGVLSMTERNRTIKTAPERWPYYGSQSVLPAGNGNPDEQLKQQNDAEFPEFEDSLDFNIIFTCEERCFDAVVEDFISRSYFSPCELNKKVHVFNIEIRDDNESAITGGKAILNLANSLQDAYNQSYADITELNENSEPFDDKIMDIITNWQSKYSNLPLLYSVCFH
ncbi:hypothetical protein B5S32_g557 [[Candida] boidinii]|nr:hypothetical protein B5S32_g557 [[Candida] boidinii]